MEEAIWEREDKIRATYSSLFEEEGTLFSHLIIIIKNDCSICMCLYVYVRVNFEKKFF